MPTDDHDIPQLDTLDAALDALDSPTTLEAFRATKAWDADMVAAAAAQRAINANGDAPGGSQTVEMVIVPIAFDTPGLVGEPGIVVAHLAVGDLLATASGGTGATNPNLFISTAWDGTTPTLHTTTEEFDPGYIFQDDLTATDTDQGGGVFFIPPGSAPTVWMRCAVEGDVIAYVDDGSGGDPGSTEGDGLLCLYIARTS